MLLSFYNLSLTKPVTLHISVDTFLGVKTPLEIVSVSQLDSQTFTKKFQNSNNMLSLVTSCISHIVECHMSVDTFFRGEDPSINSKG